MSYPDNGCIKNNICCTDSSGSSSTGFDGGFVKGSGCGAANCSARNTGCYDVIVNKCANPSRPDDLFSKTGVCAIAAADPAYKDIIAAARARYCETSNNYNNYNGYCVNWWATDRSSWGIPSNDDSVKSFCDNKQNQNLWGSQYQGVCGCYNSSLPCPDPLDQYCAGNENASPKISPAYHTRQVLDQRCDSVTICTQYSDIDDAYALLVQKQQCGNVVKTGSTYIILLIFVIIICMALNVAYVQYSLKKDKTPA